MEFLYDELLKFDLLYEQMYNMTPYELRKTLEQRREGLSYKLWKQGNLCQMMKEYPKNPEEACPELSKPKKTYKMPDFLKNKFLEQERRKNERGIWN